MRVEQFLEESVRRFGEKIALVVGEEQVSYCQLNERANHLALVLRQRGLERSERVVLFLDNSVEAVVGLFATLKAGGVFVLVNPTTKADKLAYILNNCRAKAMITHKALLRVATPALEKSPTVALALVAEGDGDTSLQVALEATPKGNLPFAGIDTDLAMLIYTSGSTGFPKGVMMTHHNMVTAATSINTYLENTAQDTILSVLPLAFDYGLYQVLMSVQMGATVVLEKSFAFPNLILERLETLQVTGFPLVPTMAALLLQMTSLVPGRFPHLRYLTNTAAALPPAHIARLQALFPTSQIFSMYGLTECKRCTYLPPSQLATRPGSVGKAIPNTEAYIVNDQNERVKPGEIGELVIRGGHVMQGYWENPEATERMLRPGAYPWERVLHTGDLFRSDEEGFLYFVGRKDDILKTRGEKVSPKEVENVLYALPGVREAAVVGVPDPILGMAIKAVIVPTEAGCLTPREVLVHCAKHLEDFMIPKLVEFRESLPKTDSGKIRRSEVQAEVHQAYATQTAPTETEPK